MQLRDMQNIFDKVKIVLIPRSQNLKSLQNWDLWGPLLFCLTLALTLSFAAKSDQSAMVFSGVFAIVWLGASLVTINAQLLKGNLTFFQSLCVLGYCMVPLVIASSVFLFIEYWILRLPFIFLSLAWSAGAAIVFLTGSVAPDRKFLVVFPIGLLYLLLGWLILCQKTLWSVDKKIVNLF